MTDDLRNGDGQAGQDAEEDPSASILTTHAQEPTAQSSGPPDEPPWASAPELVRPKPDGRAPWWTAVVDGAGGYLERPLSARRRPNGG